MIRYLSLLLLCLPLLACAAESTNPEPTAVQKRISTVLSGKSNRADRQYWHAQLKWSDDCESAFQGPPELQDAKDPDTDSGLKAYPAENQQYLMRVTCTLGSYQGYQQFYLVTPNNDKATVKALMFPIFKIENKKKVTKTLTSEVWGNVLRTSDYKNLTVLNRYSGYGHCGTLTTYRIINGEVTATKLLAQPDCESSKASRDPEKWAEYPIP
jgi:hypothetical protein